MFTDATEITYRAVNITDRAWIYEEGRKATRPFFFITLPFSVQKIRAPFIMLFVLSTILGLAAAIPSNPRPEPWGPWTAKAHPLRRSKRQNPSTSTCASGAEFTVRAPQKNIFLGLTDQEAADVTTFLHAQAALNLTGAANATAYVLTTLTKSSISDRNIWQLGQCNFDRRAPTAKQIRCGCLSGFRRAGPNPVRQDDLAIRSDTGTVYPGVHGWALAS